jgi:putative oxidoreductase
MKIATLAARIILGLAFLVFGLNFFLHFIPNQPMPDAAGAFIGALIGSGYLFTVVKVVEVVCGAAILANFKMPLALVVLFPVTLNIFLFHAFLAKDGLPIAIILLVAQLFLAYQNRDAYKGML